MAAQPIPRITPEQYLAMERAAEFRSEYIDGVIVAMAGGSPNHSLISGNVFGELWQKLKRTGCRTFNPDNRLLIPAYRTYTYPDAWVACGDVQYTDEHKDTALNPRVVIEVLSPSSKSYDRGEKFLYYRSVQSIIDYLIFSQESIRAEHHHRNEDGSWTLREYTEAEDVLDLHSIGCTLRLGDIYDQVEFDER